MKKYSIIFSIIMLLAIAAPASALNITVGSYGGYTSVETFDDINNLKWTIDGNYAIYNGDHYTNGTQDAAAPAGDSTNYLTVPKNLNTGTSATIKFNSNYNNFGLLWGSMDTYNSLTFYNSNNNVVASITGEYLLMYLYGSTALSGNQFSPYTNLYVNFLGLPDFSYVVLTSTKYAFEVDNVAVSSVPEPTTMLLLGFGLVGLAGAGRKFKK